MVGGTEDAGEALSTWAVREVADTEGRRGRCGWLGTRMTRVGVMDVVGGWRHGGRRWASSTWVVDDVADAGGRRGRLGTCRTRVGGYRGRWWMTWWLWVALSTS